MIPVKVAQLSVAQISPSDVSFVLLLRGVTDERSLPIFIAATEAQSIAIKLNGKEFPRPLTHDLLKNVLDSYQCTLRKVEVSDLVDNTFHARITLECAGSVSELDSRPSDAIALALRCSAPIYVDENVMDKAGVIVEEKEGEEEGAVVADDTDVEKSLSPLDLLHKDLTRAIDEERYEDAASLRDRIKLLEDQQASN
jgi:bifunctional DNase/RNase